jgi:hypothetical protein
MESSQFNAGVLIFVALAVLVVTVLWVLVPFILMRTNSVLRDIKMQLRRSNEHLEAMRKELERQAQQSRPGS